MVPVTEGPITECLLYNISTLISLQGLFEYCQERPASVSESDWIPSLLVEGFVLYYPDDCDMAEIKLRRPQTDERNWPFVTDSEGVAFVSNFIQGDTKSTPC